MIKLDQEVFVQTAMTSKKRVLHPAEAAAIDGDEIQIVATAQDLPIEQDQTVRIFHQAKDFMQQTATVVNITEVDGKKMITIELTSKPASAESREHHRVSTVFTDLTARVGEEPICQLVDVSTMGFAVITSQALEIGEVISTELRFDREVYPGKTCVQSVRDLGAGRMRCGLFPLADAEGGTQMFAGMQRMTTILEREQLQRLAGVS